MLTGTGEQLTSTVKCSFAWCPGVERVQISPINRNKSKRCNQALQTQGSSPDDGKLSCDKLAMAEAHPCYSGRLS